jgi:hypothetical protein
MTKHHVAKKHIAAFQSTTRLLLDLLKCDPPAAPKENLAGLKPAEWRRLTSIARQQHVSPLLYHCLKRQNLLHAAPPEIGLQLRESYFRNVASNLELYGELKMIARQLKEAEIPLMVLKGAHLAHGVYGNIGLREMLDLDLLVPQAQLFEAYQAVKALGYLAEHGEEGLDPEQLLNHRHLPGLERPSGLGVEIHWHLAVPAQWPVEELWKRAVPFRFQETEVLSLSPEDLLLHLCYHLAYDHRFRLGLRPLIDISLVIEHYAETLNWQVVEGRAGRYGWHKGVVLALSVAKAVVGAAVPERMCGIGAPLPEEAAIELVLNPDVWRGVPPNLARVWQEGSLRSKLSILAGRVFISPQELAAKYPVDAASPLRYWYYLVRFKDLLLKNLWTVGKKHQLNHMIGQHAQLKSWLRK